MEPVALRVAEWLETVDVDPLAEIIDSMSEHLPQELQMVLEGRAVGHALHPVLTDLPLGCWLAVSILDVTLPGHELASRRLLATGILCALPTILSGLQEWRLLAEPERRNVAVVHASGNLLVLFGYGLSWIRRTRGHSGKLPALASGVLALGTGYLGGHLSFGMGTGIGKRSGQVRFSEAYEQQ